MLSAGKDAKKMQNQIKAVIFDLDGVLVSTDEMHYQAWKQLAAELGIKTFTREDNIRQRGVSRMASLEIVLEKTPAVYTQAEKEKFAARKNALYCEMLKTLTPDSALPGAAAFLRYLRRCGVKTAVGSASKNAPEILRRTGLDGLLDAVSCGLDVTKSKPDPEVFLVAAQKLGVEPGACLVAEDADAGIEAALRGGMYALAVGAACGNPQAHFHVNSLAELEFLSLFR